jgi:hypothetical protein
VIIVGNVIGGQKSQGNDPSGKVVGFRNVWSMRWSLLTLGFFQDSLFEEGRSFVVHPIDFFFLHINHFDHI